MKRIVKKWIGLLVSTAFAAFALLLVFPTAALAQGFVTGSANTDGFSLVGLVSAQGNGRGKGSSLSSFTAMSSKGSPPRRSATTSTSTTS